MKRGWRGGGGAGRSAFAAGSIRCCGAGCFNPSKPPVASPLRRRRLVLLLRLEERLQLAERAQRCGTFERLLGELWLGRLAMRLARPLTLAWSAVRQRRTLVA